MTDSLHSRDPIPVHPGAMGYPIRLAPSVSEETSTLAQSSSAAVKWSRRDFWMSVLVTATTMAAAILIAVLGFDRKLLVSEGVVFWFCLGITPIVTAIHVRISDKHADFETFLSRSVRVGVLVTACAFTGFMLVAAIFNISKIRGFTDVIEWAGWFVLLLIILSMVVSLLFAIGAVAVALAELIACSLLARRK